MTLSRLQRLLLFFIAVLALVTAIYLFLWAGLPQQSDYSGYIVEGIGYVAPETGEIAPPIEADRFGSGHIHLDDFRGGPVIVNFWATWCIPCAIEMPELQTLHEETGVQILAVNIAEPENAISRWIAQYSLTFDIVLDPQGKIYRDYRLVGQPTTFVIDPDGIITHIFYGPATLDTLLDAIETHDNG